MTELERIRHSCAHVMATAIAKLWPDTQFATGPPVETGFYYDMDLEHRISPEDFPRIEELREKSRQFARRHQCAGGLSRARFSANVCEAASKINFPLTTRGPSSNVRGL